MYYLLIVVAGAPDILPHCDKYGDTYGEWIENPIAYDDGIKRFEYHNNSASSTLEELSKHFLGSVGPGAALDFPFNKVWKPKECAYHRFTNDTIHRCVKHTTNVEGTNSGKYLHIVFMGDSATRGVLCGLLRIVHGSEQFGSCESKICGDIPSHPHAVSYQEIQQINEQYLLRGKLRLTFIYEKSFIAYGWDMDNFLVTYIKENKVDYVILNTGVWDYDDIARRHIGQDAEDTCAELKNGWDYEKSIERANKHVNDTVHRLARVGKAHNITMIYRTNHHNNRYGPYCADHKVIPLYEHAGWEIWDNMRISKGKH